MIKRTLLFGSPAYLSTKNEQLLVKYPDEEQESKTVAIEDIGVLLLEDPQITITNGLIAKLVENQTAIITCDHRHMPSGLMMPLRGHSEQQERFRAQIFASEPLKKNLWQQTIQAKIHNQAFHLKERGIAAENMLHWEKSVTSGDTRNHEARAAAYYWGRLFDLPHFKRLPAGEAPNNLLNYGYAILRAVCARALVGSGLLPLLGIHHKNKYNAYCLADDIMEPYRPYVDLIVCHIVDNMSDYDTLTTRLKKELLQIPVIDVEIEGKKSPLMVAMSRTTSSLYDCFSGDTRKIKYPEF